MAQALAHLRRVEREGGAGAQVSLLDTPHLVLAAHRSRRRGHWKPWPGGPIRRCGTFLMTSIEELLAETREYARQTFPRPNATETLECALRAAQSLVAVADALHPSSLCYNNPMALIPVVGRKTWKMRALVGALYLVLSLGAVTMVYPFLVMLGASVSHSTKSPVTTSSPAICAPTRPCSASTPRTNTKATWARSMPPTARTTRPCRTSCRRLPPTRPACSDWDQFAAGAARPVQDRRLWRRGRRVQPQPASGPLPPVSAATTSTATSAPWTGPTTRKTRIFRRSFRPSSSPPSTTGRRIAASKRRTGKRSRRPCPPTTSSSSARTRCTRSG